MSVKSVLVKNKLGLHARASAKLVNTAKRFEAETKITKDERTVNAKSIMGVMLLAASKGSMLILEAEGSDAEQALIALEELIDNRFGETE